MSEDLTPRLGLPMLQPGQAQKELYHNEALALIDIAAQPSVIAVGTNVPPAAPAPGDCWIIGAAPTGAWAGRALHLAGWTPGGWRFLAPREGMAVWSIADGAQARFSSSGWTIGEQRCARLVVGGVQVIGARRPAIANPVGGSVIDAEARAALGAILGALAAHGLVGA